MTQPRPSADFAVQDVSVDQEGRVSITNPVIAGRLHAAVATKKPKPPSNTNCKGCNNKPECGSSNWHCEPNTYVQCGCIVKEQ